MQDYPATHFTFQYICVSSSCNGTSLGAELIEAWSPGRVENSAETGRWTPLDGIAILFTLHYRHIRLHRTYLCWLVTRERCLSRVCWVARHRKHVTIYPRLNFLLPESVHAVTIRLEMFATQHRPNFYMPGLTFLSRIAAHNVFSIDKTLESRTVVQPSQ